MKIFLLGWKRSGKDLAAEYLESKLGFKHIASSEFLARAVIYDLTKDKYGYSSFDECFEDRCNHREEWFDLISEYNKDDLTRLSNEVFNVYGNDIYVGIRRWEELQAAKQKWDDVIVIWIDAKGRIEPESPESCTVNIDQADIIIRNRDSLTEYYKKLDKLCLLLENK